MNSQEYAQAMQADSSWLPGKDSIINEIRNRYGDISLDYVGIREILPKNTALDGLFVYRTGTGSIKLITCGLTQIYPNEYAFGRVRSGWGAELTATLGSADNSNITLYMKLLAQLAQYINIRKMIFTEYSCFNLSRFKKPEQLLQSKLAGIVFIPDTALQNIDTIHGSVSFLQVVGICSNDWKKLKKAPLYARQYVFENSRHNPDFCLDRLEDS